MTYHETTKRIAKSGDEVDVFSGFADLLTDNARTRMRRNAKRTAKRRERREGKLAAAL